MSEDVLVDLKSSGVVCEGQTDKRAKGTIFVLYLGNGDKILRTLAMRIMISEVVKQEKMTRSINILLFGLFVFVFYFIA